MALLIERYMTQDNIPYKETLLFGSPEELSIDPEDVRLIKIEGQEGKWFWYQGMNFKSVDPDFWNDEISYQEKNWDPYTHKMEDGVKESDQATYDAYVVAQADLAKKLQEDTLAMFEKDRKDKTAVYEKMGLSAEEIAIVLG